MMRAVYLFFMALLILTSCHSSSIYNNRDSNTADPSVVLENQECRLEFKLSGGAMTSFRLKESGINPFTWSLSPADMPANNRSGAVFRGHFICLGRWGKPTAGEIREGIPSNGEPANGRWQTDYISKNEIRMSFDAPLEQYRISRRIQIKNSCALVRVTETFSNLQRSARFTNIIQHATIGPPFLDSLCITDCPAGEGFNQATAVKGLGTHNYSWPYMVADSSCRILDARKAWPRENFVTTHILRPGPGWITVYSPSAGLLLGYVWDQDSYPWIHIWNGSKDSRLWARGLEFGTTGLGDTFPWEQRIMMQFHGRKMFLFMDGRQDLTFSFEVFLLPVSGNFTGVSDIRHDQGKIQIFDKQNPEEPSYILDDIFPN